jgi:DHA1 family tetracycline resistance protein-like MFS transporter
MGLIGAAFGLGFIFGPAIGGILSRGAFTCRFSSPPRSVSRMQSCSISLAGNGHADHPAKNSPPAVAVWQLVELVETTATRVCADIYFLFIVAFSIMTTSFSLYTMFRFGYDAQHTGYLFAYVGLIAVIIQGGLIGRLVKRFGEMPLVIVGALCFAISLFAVPFVGPAAGGLAALLIGGGVFSMGNSLATPALTSLASKSVGPAQQGVVLGVTQSVASLARAVGPSLTAVLISSSIAHLGADGVAHYMSDQSLFVTFWTGRGDHVFVASLLAFYLRHRPRIHGLDRETLQTAQLARRD